MASTNKTPNYELSQFVETDRPAWLTDYNGDMRKLDTALKAVSDVASGASGGISSLTDRMTAAEGAITTNANGIDALEARADALEAGAQSTAGTIAGIQTEQTAQNLGIEAATELGYNLARPYDSASTYAVGAYVLFQNTLYKCVTAVSTGEAFDPTKWLAIKATDEIAAGGYTLPIASASLLGGVKIGDGLNIDPVTGLLSASGGVKIPLTADNFGITIQTIEGRTWKNYFTTSPTHSTQTYSNASAALVSDGNNFYYKIGNTHILSLYLQLSHDGVSVATGDVVYKNVLLSINSDLVEFPEKQTYGSFYAPTTTQGEFNQASCLMFRPSYISIRNTKLWVIGGNDASALMQVTFIY